MIRLSPGPCGVCGAAHTACTAAGVRRGAAIRIDQLPALSTTAQLREPPADLAPPPIVDLDVDDELVAELDQVAARRGLSAGERRLLAFLKRR